VVCGVFVVCVICVILVYLVDFGDFGLSGFGFSVFRMVGFWVFDVGSCGFGFEFWWFLVFVVILVVAFGCALVGFVWFIALFVFCNGVVV